GQLGVRSDLWLPALLFDLGSIGFGAAASARERAAGRPLTHRPLFLASMALGCAMAALPLARGPWETTLLMGISVAGTGGCFALLTTEMLRRVGPHRIAAASGLTAAAQSLAYIVANPLV